ncbi:hypothetical protein HN011_005819, partial [Eciton burchellii]
TAYGVTQGVISRSLSISLLMSGRNCVSALLCLLAAGTAEHTARQLATAIRMRLRKNATH